MHAVLANQQNNHGERNISYLFFECFCLFFDYNASCALAKGYSFKIVCIKHIRLSIFYEKSNERHNIII